MFTNNAESKIEVSKLPMKDSIFPTAQGLCADYSCFKAPSDIKGIVRYFWKLTNWLSSQKLDVTIILMSVYESGCFPLGSVCSA